MSSLHWFKSLVRRGSRRRRFNKPAFAVVPLDGRNLPSATLYVGDDGGNTVESFNAMTGQHLGTFVENSKSLKGVRGLLFDGDGHFLVANQNVGRGKPGEILRYDAATGDFDGELVPFQSPNAPFAPRGMVLKDNVLYVATLQNSGSSNAPIAPDGEIMRFDATTGDYLGSFTRPPGYTGQFNPRGVVFGPDGLLYVGLLDSSNLAAGHVLTYNLSTNAWGVFATNDGDGVAEPGETQTLHRPEGLVVGPDGRLYVTSYRANATDIDRVLMFDRPSGTLSDTIELYQAGQPRAFSVSVLFGPGDDLFVPIVSAGPDGGGVRRYDVVTKTYTNFVAPGTLGTPTFLTFGTTDAATLAYGSGLGSWSLAGSQSTGFTFNGATTDDDANVLGLTPFSSVFMP